MTVLLVSPLTPPPPQHRTPVFLIKGPVLGTVLFIIIQTLTTRTDVKNPPHIALFMPLPQLISSLYLLALVQKKTPIRGGNKSMEQATKMLDISYKFVFKKII